MVMSSFEHVPAEGVAHKGCRHLVDAMRADALQREALRPVLHWCASHAESAGLMCAVDAQQHEAELHHGDASFTNMVPMTLAMELVDDDGRSVAIRPDGVTIALMVFYAD